MDIKQQITKWEEYTFNRTLADIEEIVIHGTAGGGTLQYVEGGERSAEYKKGIGLFHFLIEQQTGDAVQTLPIDKWCYHSSSSHHDKKTIGIEIEKSKNTDTPADSQYQTLTDLIGFLLEQCPNIKTVVSHDYNAKTYSKKPPKPCPGAFNWDLYQNSFKNLIFHP